MSHKASKRRSTKGGASSYQQQLTVNRQWIPSHPEQEIGKEIEIFGKDWHMTGEYATRAFKCFVTSYDHSKKWTGKNVPQGSLIVKCCDDAYTEEEAQQHKWPWPPAQQSTELDLVNYGRLRHNFLQRHPEEVQSTVTAPAALPQGQEGVGPTQPQTQANKKTSKVWQYCRPIDSKQFGG